MAKKRILTVDEILDRKLGYSTKSFGESYSGRVGSDGKPFSIGETVNALVTLRSDRYKMIAEASKWKADVLTMRARGEDAGSIIDKVKDAAKGVWETIKKLIMALVDLIKNFFRKFGSREKQLDKVIREIENILAKKYSAEKGDRLKDKTFKLPVEKGELERIYAREQREIGDANGTLEKFVNASTEFTSPTKEGIIKFLETLIKGSSSKDMDLKAFEEKLGDEVDDSKVELKYSKKSSKDIGNATEDVAGKDAYDAAKQILQSSLADIKAWRDAKDVDTLKSLQRGLKNTLSTIKNGIGLDAEDSHLSQKVRVTIPKASKIISRRIAFREQIYSREFKRVVLAIAAMRAFVK